METQIVKVAIAMDDGSVAVMSFVTVGRGTSLPYGASWTGTPGFWARPASEENIYQEISRTFARHGPQPARFRVLKSDEIPSDRTFRNAWTERDGKIDTDMPRARQIHLGRLRRRRDRELEELDKQHRRASGQGKAEEAQTIEARRQAWRDMPNTLAPALDAANTPDTLKLVNFEA